MTEKTRESTFSIEMGSKGFLKNVKLSESPHESVLIEGTLGEIEEIKLHEDVILEVKGTYGALRIDIDGSELESCLRKDMQKRRSRMSNTNRASNSSR